MERARFVRELATGEWTMTELCEHHGVSRPTGYKWARRYRADGDDGLKELSRAPRGCPHRTATEVEKLIVLLKKTHGWGARKLHRLIRKQVSAAELPCRSTVFDILKRHGLVKSRRRRQKWQHPGAAPLHTDAPNEVLTDDRFQGPVQDSRRHLLLSADPAGPLQPVLARVPCVVRCEDRRSEGHSRTGVPPSMACRRRSAATTDRRSRRPGSMDSAD